MESLETLTARTLKDQAKRGASRKHIGAVSIILGVVLLALATVFIAHAGQIAWFVYPFFMLGGFGVAFGIQWFQKGMRLVENASLQIVVW